MIDLQNYVALFCKSFYIKRRPASELLRGLTPARLWDFWSCRYHYLIFDI